MNNHIYAAPQALGKGDGSCNENAADLLSAVKLAENKAAIIHLLPGTYYLSETLQLNEGHQNITFRGENAVIASGKPITGWQDEGNGIVSAGVEPNAVLNRLYFNGAARERTRLPETGHWETKQVVKLASLWLADMTPEQ